MLIDPTENHLYRRMCKTLNRGSKAISRHHDSRHYKKTTISVTVLDTVLLSIMVPVSVLVQRVVLA
jgi:hypothetical protein